MSAIVSPLPVQFYRLNHWPGFANEIFANLSEAEIYATSPTAYAGQKLSVVATNPPSVKNYQIQHNKTLKLTDGFEGIMTEQEKLLLESLANKLQSEGFLPFST